MQGKERGIPMERQMEYVYMVYKTGSFSKAAEFLYTTQPTVSMAVQRMEEEIGSQIFNRKTKPMKLTEAGKRLIQHIERIRHALEEAGYDATFK